MHKSGRNKHAGTEMPRKKQEAMRNREAREAAGNDRKRAGF